MYNVVRGIDVVDFDRKAKSHSISNETTFPVDISDTYTVETAILELCHSVIFRLLKENGFSRTVQVKIRYEDFSTVSIQQTYSNSILTLDSLYTAAKELFERKYERTRGIRLIGIALENIENTERSVQPSLFDDGSEKKQNVEKAILTLEKKHPEIKIHKARMLQKLDKGIKIFVTVLMLALCGAAGKTYAQEKQTTDTWEIQGYWKGDLQGTVDSTFGFGNAFGISAQPPVFKQEVDLSALVHITPQFFFSVQFMDEFKYNTYTLGYDGTNYLNLFRFSNRNITFPVEYSSNKNGYGVSGGNNEAPGVMFHFNDYENNRWSGDILLRYDMVETKTATFYGKNQVTDSNIRIQDFSECSMFVIPSDVINNIKNVYVETQTGMAKTDFLIFPSQNLLVLTGSEIFYAVKKTVPYVVITFYDSNDCVTLLNDTGSYADSSSFAGQIQQFFDSSENPVNLSEYSPLELDKLTYRIEGENTDGFIIQGPLYFSPYVCANLYKTQQSMQADFLVTESYSGTQSSFYNAGTLPYEFDDQNYIRVYNTSNENAQPLSPQYRYPFADRYPDLYLNKNKDADSQKTYPLAITARNYNPVKEYDIGKKASQGTVQVYINGILEPAAFYDSDSGFVKLPYEVGEFDKVYITYSEESSDISNGVVTSAIGFVYNFLPELALDLSFTGKYPYTAQKYKATPQSSYKTFSAFSTGLTYNNNKLTAYDAVTVAIEDTNTTDILLLEADKGDGKDTSEFELTWTDSDEKIVTQAYFTASDFSQYESINFDVAITSPVELTVTLLGTQEQKAMEIRLCKDLCSELVSAGKTWHKIRINLKSSAVYLDDVPLDKSLYELTLDKDIVPQCQKICVLPLDISEPLEEKHVYVSSVYYKNNMPFFTTKNKAGVKYEDQIWFLQAESTQGISIRTDNGKKLSDSVNANAKGGVTLFDINLTADADTSKNAGHSLKAQKLLFKVFDFGEIYRYSDAADSFEKKDYLKLDFAGVKVPVAISGQTYARKNSQTQQQNYVAQLTTDIKSVEAGFSAGAKMTADQKKDTGAYRVNHYFATWYDASKYEFSSGDKLAKRNVGFVFDLKGMIPLAKLTPQLTIDYATAADTFRFALPFSTQNNAFTVNITHKATLELDNSQNKNYGDDIKTLFSNQTKYDFLYRTIPYYSLFDKQLAPNLKDTVLSGYTNYATQLVQYDFGWKRKRFNDIKDLYIPSAATAGAARNLVSTGATTNDVYELKASLTDSFVNLFAQEEYTGTLSAVYKFSQQKKSEDSFTISMSELLLYYIDNSNTLTVNTDFSIDNKVNWIFKAAATWGRSSQNSILLALTKAVWKKSNEMDFKSTVRDSVNLSLSRQNKINKQTYEYLRSAEIGFTDMISVNSGAGILFGFEQDKTFKLSLSYKLGIKISF